MITCNGVFYDKDKKTYGNKIKKENAYELQ